MRAGTALRAGRNGDHTVSAIPGGIDIALLRRNRLLSLLEPAEMDEVLRFARIRKVQPEERIFAKGDPGDCMYAILKGRVSVETESEDAKVMLLNLLAPMAGRAPRERGSPNSFPRKIWRTCWACRARS